jgi:hypothetical protein
MGGRVVVLTPSHVHADVLPPCHDLQVRVDFDQPGLPRRVKQSGKWLSQNVLTKSKKK